jgi:hypothetical protein
MPRSTQDSGSGSDPSDGFASGIPDPRAMDPDEAAALAEMARVRAELAVTPVADIVANHAMGLWQLAVLHLTPEGDETPRLDEAGLAIDALASLVEGLGERLGENAEPLLDALAQLRLAYVQVQGRIYGER